MSEHSASAEATSLVDQLSTASNRFAQPRSAPERVADFLREEIVQGRLGSGTQLTEESISGTLSVARNTVREAFTLLTAERLVAREPHRGVFVRQLSLPDIADLYRMRRIVEPSALRSGPEFGEHSVDLLEAAVSEGYRAQQAEDRHGVASANQEWHRHAVGIAGSQRLDHTMSGLLAEMRLVFAQMDNDVDFHAKYLARNEEITSIAAQGERGRAADALDAYLAEASADIQASLSSE
ncbi:GntR family transcriptional regulator [Ornithinimicrobium sp. INDO-MA30-4]|uniref:GntR family transcriptional regulator n=1 Tax=Ornithinimicrobium sp. INDO-MA30-4 TaxID=2908651 RepID=UPI001F490695|nr:GntR family transcriptional regulator [Ornithinimicrobium sp. INDO-MA30-4]UJH69965.1 GntR family transcriptional regulator [Ornithinimicrobium sp. INDO-MA30-4]